MTMKNFQTYFTDSTKLFEFRIKLANYDLSAPSSLDGIKNALDAYCVETISKPKRLPIQEHKDLSKIGPCECYIIDVAVKYPTIAEQVRQLIVNRAMIKADCVCVYTKAQAENLDMVQERIDAQGEVLSNDDVDNNTAAVEEAQSQVGDIRVGSLLKELESRKYEFAQASNEAGKSTNDIPTNDKSPIKGQK